VADLKQLCAEALRRARDGEQVEAYAEEGRRIQVKARDGGVESMSSSETRGVGVRVVAEGRLGYAYAADPSLDEVSEAVGKARTNAALATPDDANALPERRPALPLPEIFRASQQDVPTERKVTLALELEQA